MMVDNDLVFTVKIKFTTIIFLNVKLVFISDNLIKITKNVVKLKLSFLLRVILVQLQLRE